MVITIPAELYKESAIVLEISVVKAIVPFASGRVIVLLTPAAEPLRVVLVPESPSWIEPVPLVLIEPPPLEVSIDPPVPSPPPEVLI